MNWYIDVLKKYADFNGRARRKEYWLFTLWNCLIYLGYFILATGLTAMGGRRGAGAIAVMMFVPLWAYAVAIIVPSLAVSVRRLHDTGKSGWWILIGLVPFVGGIICLVFMCMDSQPGQNEYGPNPKGVQAYAQYTPAAPPY